MFYLVHFIFALLVSQIEAVSLQPQLRYEACIPTVDCSWFYSDLDVIYLLPFSWSPGHSQYTTDANDHVITLSIVGESTVPLIMYCLKNLNSLTITTSNIDRLPAEVRFLSNLVSIDLHHNENLTHVADEIGELRMLKELHISGSRKISCLPADVGKFLSLTDLSVTFGSLEDVPSSIGKLYKLESLDLSGNRLAGLPHNLKELTSVRSLKLNNNPIISSLQEITALANLRQLYMVGCGMKEIPSTIISMTMLEMIDFGANELTSITYDIGKMINLRSLHLGGNQFTSIPRELVLVRNLTILNIDGNRLTDISAVGTLKQIRYLYLNRNQITSVPSDIGKLNQTLEYLNLDDNKLTGLPKELAHMSQLKTLYIRNNNFSATAIEEIRDLFADNGWTRVYY